jgi:spermidine/putrescine transport system ATP-binding protein
LKLRKELQQELRALQRRTGVTFIYVTHDQDEALSMSDRIAVMNEGKLVQLGTPTELYEKPRTRFVAQFLGGCNLIEAQLKQRDTGETVVETSAGELRVETADTRSKFTLAIRPEKILLSENGTANSFAAEIIETTYSGVETHCIARVGSETLRITSINAATQTPVRIGERVRVTLPGSAFIVLED